MGGNSTAEALITSNRPTTMATNVPVAVGSNSASSSQGKWIFYFNSKKQTWTDNYSLIFVQVFYLFVYFLSPKTILKLKFISLTTFKVIV